MAGCLPPRCTMPAMRRRSFLASLATSAVLPYWQTFAQTRPSGNLTIRDIELWRVEGERTALQGVNRQHQVQPLHVYEAHRPKVYSDPASPQSGTSKVSAIYLKIVTDQGLEGIYGPVDREGAVVIDLQLAGFLKGKDPLAGEALWDQLFRTNRHSRAGHYMIGISAIDNAIWDLRGRYYNAPVYRLLGGPTRSEVEVYGSCLGFSVEPEADRK